MRIIKRYSNRKLYDVNTSKTVTLAEIAEMIKQGDEIKVIEANDEGSDITNRVMAQIFVHENLDTKHMFMRKFLLEGLIKESGDKFGHLIKKMLFAGVGLASLSQEKIEHLVNELVKRGELSEDEKAKFVKSLITKMEQGSSDFKNMFTKVINSTTPKEENKEDEITDLKSKIDELTKTIEEMKNKKS